MFFSLSLCFFFHLFFLSFFFACSPKSGGPNFVVPPLKKIPVNDKQQEDFRIEVNKAAPDTELISITAKNDDWKDLLVQCLEDVECSIEPGGKKDKSEMHKGVYPIFTFSHVHLFPLSPSSSFFFFLLTFLLLLPLLLSFFLWLV